jgi:hypothetical protein
MPCGCNKAKKLKKLKLRQKAKAKALRKLEGLKKG